ncbi:MAG TPA: type VI secretion system contractile sheath small subunit, partial [Paraburkholderia sp.]|nr:type VI secretion system contractile sheath small subunit [Paraburkholderia sp.]
MRISLCIAIASCKEKHCQMCKKQIFVACELGKRYSRRLQEGSLFSPTATGTRRGSAMASDGSVAPKERVNIVYRPATGDAKAEVELPLKLLVLGDFTL